MASTPPRDDGGLTAGDPLRPDGAAPQARPAAEAYAPPRPAPGYGPGRPAPPGAGGTVTPWGAPSPAAGRHTLAGWWRRAVAAIIDGVVIAVLASVLLVPLGIGAFAVDSDTGVVALVAALLLTIVVIAIVSLLYAPLMMWKTNGRTLGRMATGIRVVRADGAPMTLGTALIREVILKALVFGVLSSLTAGIAGLADVLWPLWDEENRALHDFPVDTRTVLA